MMKQLLTLSLFGLLLSFQASGQCNFDPVISVNPFNPDFVYCPGEVVLLSTEEYDAYQWYYNFDGSNTGGTPINGANGQQFAVDISFWGFAYFYVEATLAGCTEASPAQIIDSWVFLPPVVQSEGQTTFCEGDSTEILMPSPGVFKYRWYRDGVLIPGANQSNYWVKESGMYVVEVAYEQCPDLWLSSGVGPEFFFIDLEVPSIALSGDTLTADSGTQWQWLLNGELITGATGPSWVALESGEYSLLFTDANGCSGLTPPVSVTVTSVREIGAVPVRVFPNPAQDVVFVESGAEMVRVLVFDPLGRIVRNEEPLGTEMNISLQGLVPGTYGLQVMLGDGRQHRVMVVKWGE